MCVGGRGGGLNDSVTLLEIVKPIESLAGRPKRVNLMPNISVRQD